MIKIEIEGQEYELDDCPFDHGVYGSGQEFTLIRSMGDFSISEYSVRCDICHARGAWGHSIQDAVESWNGRSEDVEEYPQVVQIKTIPKGAPLNEIIGVSRNLLGEHDDKASFPSLFILHYLRKLVRKNESDAAYLYWKFTLEPDYLNWRPDKTLEWARALCEKSGIDYDETVEFGLADVL